MKPRHCLFVNLLPLILGTLFMLGGSRDAFAHKLAPSLLQIDEVTAENYHITWRTPRNAQVSPKPVFPDTCRGDSPEVGTVGTALEWRWSLVCDGGLGGQTLAIESLAASRTAALIRYQALDAPLQQQLLTADNPRYRIQAKAGDNRLIRQYVLLGAKHILIGIDHLFFVTGLLLLAGRWQTLLKTVTAFTVGHSLTLALVSLKIIPQWPALIELGIAATILVLAIELSRHHDPRHKTLLSRYQWPMAALFGLVHGLGFAGVLNELGLPSGDILPALLAFNIGIEAGQLVFVSTMGLLFLLFRRASHSAHVVARNATTYAMGSVSVYWCLNRGLTLLKELT